MHPEFHLLKARMPLIFERVTFTIFLEMETYLTNKLTSNDSQFIHNLTVSGISFDAYPRMWAIRLQRKPETSSEI